MLSPDRKNIKSDTSTILLVCLDVAPEQHTSFALPILGYIHVKFLKPSWFGQLNAPGSRLECQTTGT
jgi:hypothetical protein